MYYFLRLFAWFEIHFCYYLFWHWFVRNFKRSRSVKKKIAWACYAWQSKSTMRLLMKQAWCIYTYTYIHDVCSLCMLQSVYNNEFEFLFLFALCEKKRNKDYRKKRALLSRQAHLSISFGCIAMQIRQTNKIDNEWL